MAQRIAIVSGCRTPFCRAGGVLSAHQADQLAVFAVRELVARAPFSPELIEEVIMGNVLQPSHAINIARIISVKSGLSTAIPAYTVSRNCASGMEAVTSAADKIAAGQADIILAGGVESMSNFQVYFPQGMKDYLQKVNKAKGKFQKLRQFLSFHPKYIVPQIPSISDPLCGLVMGQTAELLNREFHITREEQDLFALESQKRAVRAMEQGIFAQEIVPIPIAPDFKNFQSIDDGPRKDQTLEALQKLKPAFDPLTGSVTAGTSSQVTDGAVALFLMSESKAKELGITPLGYLSGYSVAGCDPSRMGLGPVYAVAKLLDRLKITLKDVDLMEINEAFAGQVIAVMRAFASEQFAKTHLNWSTPLGEIDLARLNVNGGAIALGHPLGATGARLILTLLLELRRQKKRLGIATLCVGGGQGEACLLESAIEEVGA